MGLPSLIIANKATSVLDTIGYNVHLLKLGQRLCSTQSFSSLKLRAAVFLAFVFALKEDKTSDVSQEFKPIAPNIRHGC